MSEIVNIAKAVRDELNNAADGTFSVTFTAEFKYVMRLDIRGFSGRKVTVALRDMTSELSERDSSVMEYEVQVGVQEKVSMADGEPVASEVDAVMTFVEELADYLSGRDLAGYADAYWTATATDPIYVPDHLQASSVVTSVLTFTYSAMRSI